MGKLQKHNKNITNESQEVTPFPARHKAAMKDAKAWQIQHINNMNDPQMKYRLGTISKNILLDGLNRFHGKSAIRTKINKGLLATRQTPSLIETFMLFCWNNAFIDYPSLHSSLDV